MARQIFRLTIGFFYAFGASLGQQWIVCLT
jgi:hypothetical protein